MVASIMPHPTPGDMPQPALPTGDAARVGQSRVSFSDEGVAQEQSPVLPLQSPPAELEHESLPAEECRGGSPADGESLSAERRRKTLTANMSKDLSDWHERLTARVALRGLTSSNLRESSRVLVNAAQDRRCRRRMQLKHLLDTPFSSLSAFLIVFTLHVFHIVGVFNMYFASQIVILDAPRSNASRSGVGPQRVPSMLTSLLALELDPVAHEQQLACTIEAVCTAVFTVELAARMAIGTIDVRRMVIFSFLFWVDVLSTVPAYIELGMLASRQGSPFWALRAEPPWSGWSSLQEMTLLMRLARVLKLLRHYPGLPVLVTALQRCFRAVLVPFVGMCLAIVLLGSALFIVERRYGPEDGFVNMWDAMWAIFWIITTLGYDGYYGFEGWNTRLIYSLAVLTGLVFTTMPITIIGEAFASAWEEKEKLEVANRVQDLLFQRGWSHEQLIYIFQEFDVSGDGLLDWHEFKAALETLELHLPVKEKRKLFALLDSDDEGSVSYTEFAMAIFPNMDMDSPTKSPVTLMGRIEKITGIDLDGDGGVGDQESEEARKRKRLAGFRAASSILVAASHARNKAASILPGTPSPELRSSPDGGGAISPSTRVLKRRSSSGKFSGGAKDGLSPRERAFDRRVGMGSGRLSKSSFRDGDGSPSPREHPSDRLTALETQVAKLVEGQAEIKALLAKALGGAGDAAAPEAVEDVKGS